MLLPNWLRPIVAPLTSGRVRRTPRRPGFPPRLGIEPLEDRSLPSVTTLGDLYPGAYGSNPHGFTEVNGFIHFSGNDATSTGVWRTDGTPTGTLLLAQGTAYTFDQKPVIGYGGAAYFITND